MKISKIGIRWFYFRYKASKIRDRVAEMLERNNIGRIEFIVYCVMSLLAALCSALCVEQRTKRTR